MTEDAPVPRPAVTIVALMFAAGTLFSMGWDATHVEYAGERVTFFLGIVTFAMLGYDVRKLYFRNGGKPDA